MHLKIPPALQVLIIALMMWSISRFTSVSFDFQGRQNLGWVVFYTGLFIAILGVLNFKKAKTTVNPLQPHETSKLVITGIYKFTRNPMYLGMLLVLIAYFIKIGNYLNISTLILFEIIDYPIQNIRNISAFMSHNRLSLLINISIFSLGYILFSKKKIVFYF